VLSNPSAITTTPVTPAWRYTGSRTPGWISWRNWYAQSSAVQVLIKCVRSINKEAHAYWRIDMWNEKDIFTWSWQESYKASKQHEPYWCKARIGIVNNDKLWDIYWIYDIHAERIHSDHGARFTVKDAQYQINLKKIGNLDDLEKAYEYQRAYYNDSDFIDLRHPNNTRDGFYIKKSAERNLEKMRRIQERYIIHLKKELENKEAELVRAEQSLEDITLDSHLYTSDVSLRDHYYLDEVPETKQEACDG
jgi:hypothetical protein